MPPGEVLLQAGLQDGCPDVLGDARDTAPHLDAVGAGRAQPLRRLVERRYLHTRPTDKSALYLAV
jgi:hypothetical protein